MPSRRYTVRLPAPLDGAVQAHLYATGLPFADLMREALVGYLADIPPTGQRTGPPTAEPPRADTPPTPADTVQRLAEQLADLTQRVESLEQERTPRRQRSRQHGPTADSPVSSPPTGADTGTPAYDPTRYVLGRLCPRHHAYASTGMSLRHVRNRGCVECDRLEKRARRARRRQQG